MIGIVYTSDIFYDKLIKENISENILAINSYKQLNKNIQGLLFTGGADVDPKLYNDHSPLNLCHSNYYRDKIELEIANKAIDYKIPMFGICRGLQFLNVVSGGALLHHIDYHETTVHKIEILKKYKISVNSLHHQSCIPHKDMIVLAKSANIYYKNNIQPTAYGFNDEIITKFDIIEMAAFNNINAYGVQYHPEIMNNTLGKQLFIKIVKNIIHKNIKSQNIPEYIKDYFNNMTANMFI